MDVWKAYHEKDSVEFLFPLGDDVISVSLHGIVSIWLNDTRQQKQWWKGHVDQTISSCVVLSSTYKLWCASHSSGICIWDLHSLNMDRHILLAEGIDIYCMCQQGQFVLIGSKGKILLLSHLGDFITSWSAHNSNKVRSVCITPSDKPNVYSFWSCGWDCNLSVWSYRFENDNPVVEKIVEINFYSRPVCLLYSRELDRVFCGNSSSMVTSWSTKETKLMDQFRADNHKESNAQCLSIIYNDSIRELWVGSLSCCINILKL